MVLGLDNRTPPEAGVADAVDGDPDAIPADAAFDGPPADARVGCSGGASLIRTDFTDDSEIAVHWNTLTDGATIRADNGALMVRPGLQAYPRLRSKLSYDFTGKVAQVRLVKTLDVTFAEMFLYVSSRQAAENCYVNYQYGSSTNKFLAMACRVGTMQGVRQDRPVRPGKPHLRADAALLVAVASCTARAATPSTGQCITRST